MSVMRHSAAVAVLCSAVLGLVACAQPAYDENGVYTPQFGQAGKDVMWVPTAQVVVDRMLALAQVTPGDFLVDLGSGDGRTVIAAAKQGARAHGIEFNPDLVVLSQQAAAREGLADRATFEQGDIFKTDFSDASVVTLFLLTELNLKLRPILLNMKPGTRIVSNSFDMGDWRPDETATVTDHCSGFCTTYKWVVPAHVAGTWHMESDARLELAQTFQMVRGSLYAEDDRTSIRDARMNGSRIEFRVGDDLYTGEVVGDTLRGMVNGVRAWSAQRSVG